MAVADARLSSQGLIAPDAMGPGAVARRLLAIQAQDPRGARLAVRARLADGAEAPRASAVDEALDRGELVVGWLNRGTLHLVLADDYRWLAALTGPRLVTSNRTRLKQEGVSPDQAEKAVSMIRRRLADGPETRAEIRDLLESAGIPVAGQALVHILYLASLRGHVVRGPMIGRDQAFVLTDDWLGAPRPFDPDAALAELARRYLVGHGPATDRDLAKWAGLTLGQARRGLREIASELRETGEMVDLAEKGEVERAAPVRLLGPFDPILHGWESREWIVPGERERGVVTTNGLFRPTIFDGRRVVGTWRLAGGEMSLDPFADLPAEVDAALAGEAEAVRAYLAG